MKWEGGYSDRPKDKDPGRRTHFGISEETFKRAKERGVIDSRIKEVKDVTKNDAITFYRDISGSFPVVAGSAVMASAMRPTWARWGIMCYPAGSFQVRWRARCCWKGYCGYALVSEAATRETFRNAVGYSKVEEKEKSDL